MPLSAAVLEDVRRLVADVLQIELDEIEAPARFFGDLGGESLDLLELSFRMERHFSVRVRFNNLTANEIELDEKGCLTPASLALLKSKYPFMKLAGYESQPLKERTDLLTIEAIAGFVQAALDSRESGAVAATATDSPGRRNNE